MQKRIPIMASELRRFIRAYKYSDWIDNVTQEFKLDSFIKGLNWFANSSCNGCLNGGGMLTCEVRNCCKEKDLENCYFCRDFLKCEKLNYQKETYEIDRSYLRIKEIGYENWLKGQEEKTKANFDNICYLENKVAE